MALSCTTCKVYPFGNGVTFNPCLPASIVISTRIYQPEALHDGLKTQRRKKKTRNIELAVPLGRKAVACRVALLELA